MNKQEGKRKCIILSDGTMVSRQEIVVRIIGRSRGKATVHKIWQKLETEYNDYTTDKMIQVYVSYLIKSGYIIGTTMKEGCPTCGKHARALSMTKDGWLYLEKCKLKHRKTLDNEFGFEKEERLKTLHSKVRTIRKDFKNV